MVIVLVIPIPVSPGISVFLIQECPVLLALFSRMILFIVINLLLFRDGVSSVELCATAFSPPGNLS